MADRRYYRDRNDPRQAEQFEPDRRWRGNDWSPRQMDDWDDEDPGRFDMAGQSYSREPEPGRGWGREPRYHPGSERTSYRRSRSGREQPGFGSFTGNDFGGRDFSTPQFTNRRTHPGGYGAGSQLAADHGEWHDYGAAPSRESRDYRGTWGGNGERNWFDRATDTVAGWFSDDDDDDGRRERGYGFRGHGPMGYTRSDERILEDASDALTDDWGVDARQITVSVRDGEITLDGTVPSRRQKRRAEDCVEDLSGVRHVQNNLRVQETGAWDRTSDAEADSYGNPPSTQA